MKLVVRKLFVGLFLMLSMVSTALAVITKDQREKLEKDILLNFKIDDKASNQKIAQKIVDEHRVNDLRTNIEIEVLLGSLPQAVQDDFIQMVWSALKTDNEKKEFLSYVKASGYAMIAGKVVKMEDFSIPKNLKVFESQEKISKREGWSVIYPSS